MNTNNNNRELMNTKGSYLLNTIFIKDGEFKFVFKKTEKIVTAVYLVSDFFNDNEPLKWSLRKVGNSLIKEMVSFNEGSNLNMKLLLLELETVFNLAYNSGYVSPMNYEILSEEINKLSIIMDSMGNKTSVPENNLLSTEDFNVSESFNSIKDIDKGHDSYKRHTNVFDKTNNLRDYTKPDTKVSYKANTHKKTNSDRRERILEEIKKKGEVSVKDIARVVTDCSEKTLQRELLSMVDDGVLEKKGERRWSRYSVKKS